MADGPLAQLRALRAALHQHPLRAGHARVVDKQLRQRPLQDLDAALQAAEVGDGVAVHVLDHRLPAAGEVRHEALGLGQVHGRLATLARLLRLLRGLDEGDERPEVSGQFRLHKGVLLSSQQLLKHPRRVAPVRLAVGAHARLLEHGEHHVVVVDQEDGVLLVGGEEVRHAQQQLARRRPQPLEDVVDLGVAVVGVEAEHGGGELGVAARDVVRVHVLAPEVAVVAGAHAGDVCVRHRLQPRPQQQVDLVDVAVQARHAPFLHDELVLVVDPDHEQQADGVVAALQHRLEALLHEAQHALVHVPEDGRVALPELVAEEELVAGGVHEHLVGAAEEHLVGVARAGGGQRVRHQRGGGVQVRQYRLAPAQREHADAVGAGDGVAGAREEAGDGGLLRADEVRARGHLRVHPQQRRQVRPELPPVDPRHRVHVRRPHLCEDFRPVVLEEGGEALELEQHRLLQDLVVGLGPPQEVELLQQSLADPPRRLQPQPVQLGLNVLEGSGLPRELVVGAELEAVAQRHEICEIVFGHVAVKDVCYQPGGHRQPLYKLPKLRLCSLAVAQLDGHGEGLLLQRFDLGADVAQIRLEAAQEILHLFEDCVAGLDLLVQLHQVVALMDVVLDGVQLYLPQPCVYLPNVLPHIRPLAKNIPNDFMVAPQLQLFY
mmetsp:Transcript_24487/g.53446  ORF Transcript_24487/g.53446 Transcript_24487/m.53446 type:complete len:661 (-) Transcript_24487:375-2357(-)